MKVRVSYATEAKELPEKLSELIQKNISTSEEITSLIDLAMTALSLDGDDSVVYSYQIIDKIRKKLTKIDESLVDVAGLMGGYINNILNPQPQPDETTLAKVWDPKTKTYKETDTEKEQE